MTGTPCSADISPNYRHQNRYDFIFKQNVSSRHRYSTLKCSGDTLKVVKYNKFLNTSFESSNTIQHCKRDSGCYLKF
jgi:hypothetical protein